MPPFLTLDKDLFRYSSFHTPATARYFFELREKSDIEKLPDIFRFAEENDLPIIFLGSGTNVVFAFETFEGVIIKNSLRGMAFKEDMVSVASGELATALALKVAETHSKSLFEKWIWLPGTIGGAVAGNAGCFGFEAKDAVIEATIFDTETGEYKTLQNSELDFSYRHSLLKDRPNWFLVDATFRTDLVSDDTTDPRTFRSGKQPTGFTCGSFFRNPPGDSAGRVIDAAGLKGHRTWGVKISEIHANFFVNDENGSYRDILALRDLAKEKAQEIFGIELHEEARIIENR